MIKKLNKYDSNKIFQLFGDRKDEYTLVIDTIMDNNFENNSVNSYGELEDEKLVSLLLQNNGNLTYYAREERSITAYKTLLNELDFFKISCESKFITSFSRFLKEEDIECSQFGYVKQPIVNDFNFDELDYSIDCLNDNKDLIIDTYFAPLTTVDPNIKDRALHVCDENSNQKMFCLSKNGKAYASAMIVVKQSSSAIIHGVMTSEECRKQGLSYYLLSQICNNLLQENRYTYLFYINPAAKSLFLKMGMTEIGDWSILYL